jgi:hypothetical protein
MNEWSSLQNPNDVSEGESFLWVGKIKHHIKNLKSNQIETVELKCLISSAGVYNLNRFKILINDENEI